MKSIMAIGAVRAVVVGVILGAIFRVAGAAAPERDAKPALPVGPGAITVEGGRTVHHATDFGWAANEDVTQRFDELLKSGKLKPGEELVLDHTYRIAGRHKLPAHFTLSALKGAGLNVTDAAAKPAQNPLLELADGDVLRNLTITYLDTPPLGPTGIQHGVNFFDRIGIGATDKQDLRIENCRLIGSIAHHIALKDCSRPKVIGCHIAGGFWTVSLVGVADAVFQRCLIEKCQGDGIKTCRGARGVVRGVLVENCVFQDNGRDGIDTTGGFADAVVRGTIFRRLGACGMDIKSYYESQPGRKADLSPQNFNIRVENCLFHDVPNAIVLTTEDYGRARGGPEKSLLNAANIKTCAPHDIDINDCVFGYAEKPRPSGEKGGYGVKYPSQQGEHMNMILLKDAYAIRYRNARFSADRVRPYRISSNGGSSHLALEAAQALDHDVTGNVLAEPAPPIKPGVTEPPFACGPQPR